MTNHSECTTIDTKGKTNTKKILHRNMVVFYDKIDYIQEEKLIMVIFYSSQYKECS